MVRNRVLVYFLHIFSYKIFKKYMDETYYAIKPKYRLDWLSCQRNISSMGIPFTILIMAISLPLVFSGLRVKGMTWSNLIILGIGVFIMFFVNAKWISNQDKYCDEKYLEMK